MKVYEVLKRGLLLAILAGIGTAIALLTWKAVAIATVIETEAGQVGARAERQIAIQGDRTRDLVRTVAADLAVRMERQVAGLRGDLQQESAAFRETADMRLAAIQQDAREQLVGFRQVAETQLGQANASIAQVADLSAPLGRTAERVDAAAAILLDCKGNPACLPSQTLALVGSARHTMGQVAIAAPESSRAFIATSHSVAGIAADFKTFTGKFVAPKPWYKHVGDTVLGFAGIARFFK